MCLTTTGSTNKIVQNNTVKDTIVNKVAQPEVAVENIASISSDSAKFIKQNGGSVPKDGINLDTTTYPKHTVKNYIHEHKRGVSQAATLVTFGTVIGGMIGGAGLALASKSLPLMALGGAIEIGALSLPKLIKGETGDRKEEASNTVAFAGTVSSIGAAAGIGFYVFKESKSPVAGIAVGAGLAATGIYYSMFASDEIKNID
jgi:hypothetical protein